MSRTRYSHVRISPQITAPATRYVIGPPPVSESLLDMMFSVLVVGILIILIPITITNFVPFR